MALPAIADKRRQPPSPPRKDGWLLAGSRSLLKECGNLGAIGESRTEEELHAAALARQPGLRRVCQALTPLVLLRLAR